MSPPHPTFQNQKRKLSIDNLYREMRTPDQDCLKDHQPVFERKGALYIDDTMQPEKISKTMAIDFNLYSPKKVKTPQGFEKSTIWHFTLPQSEHLINISNTSLDDFKNHLFLLADDVDMNQLGHRNSSALKSANKQNLVSIYGYIADHKDYDKEKRRLLWSDSSLNLFFNEVEKWSDWASGIIVTMRVPFETESATVMKGLPELSETECKSLPELIETESKVPMQGLSNDSFKGGYLEFQGYSIWVDHHTLDYLRGKAHLGDFLKFASIPAQEIENVIDILKPHRINSFDKFLFPAILNVEHLAKWGIRFGTAMDIIFKARAYYQHLVGRMNRKEI